jgi:hypothetical protein
VNAIGRATSDESPSRVSAFSIQYATAAAEGKSEALPLLFFFASKILTIKHEHAITRNLLITESWPPLLLAHPLYS